MEEGETLVNNETVIVIDCRRVWREISDYVDDTVDGVLRARMEAHFKDCSHCRAVLDGTRNVVRLISDERVFEIPAGFSDRLKDRLNTSKLS